MTSAKAEMPPDSSTGACGEPTAKPKLEKLLMSWAFNASNSCGSNLSQRSLKAVSESIKAMGQARDYKLNCLGGFAYCTACRDKHEMTRLNCLGGFAYCTACQHIELGIFQGGLA